MTVAQREKTRYFFFIDIELLYFTDEKTEAAKIHFSVRFKNDCIFQSFKCVRSNLTLIEGRFIWSKLKLRF